MFSGISVKHWWQVCKYLCHIRFKNISETWLTFLIVLTVHKMPKPVKFLNMIPTTILVWVLYGCVMYTVDSLINWSFRETTSVYIIFSTWIPVKLKSIFTKYMSILIKLEKLAKTVLLVNENRWQSYPRQEVCNLDTCQLDVSHNTDDTKMLLYNMCQSHLLCQ